MKGMGKTLASICFVGFAAAICFWPHADKSLPPDDSVRPVMSVVVRKGLVLPDLAFAGKIKANEDRSLAFKQSGRIQRIPVSSGQFVKKGDKLAWLDPLDFQNTLAHAEAAEKRDRLSYERKVEAGKKNAISKEEVSQAESQLRQSEAQLALARRALEDTVLLAAARYIEIMRANPQAVFIPLSPGDGGGTYCRCKGCDNGMTPSDKIVIVHDLTKVKIDVVYPETIAIAAKKLKSTKCKENDICGIAKVSFDSVPGRQFPVKFVEFVSTADTKTQTYLATYVMDTPADLMLLPGMSATLSIRGDSYTFEGGASADALALPESAVGIDDDGSHFAWVLEETAEKGVFAARRRKLEVLPGLRTHGRLLVSSGVKDGERVATAGVSLLFEGRKVRLMDK